MRILAFLLLTVVMGASWAQRGSHQDDDPPPVLPPAIEGSSTVAIEIQGMPETCYASLNSARFGVVRCMGGPRSERGGFGIARIYLAEYESHYEFSIEGIALWEEAPESPVTYSVLPAPDTLEKNAKTPQHACELNVPDVWANIHGNGQLMRAEMTSWDPFTKVFVCNYAWRDYEPITIEGGGGWVGQAFCVYDDDCTSASRWFPREQLWDLYGTLHPDVDGGEWEGHGSGWYRGKVRKDEIIIRVRQAPQ